MRASQNDLECCDEGLANCLRFSIGINRHRSALHTPVLLLRGDAMFLHRQRQLGDRTRPSRSYHRPLSQHHDATGPIGSVHSVLLPSLHLADCARHRRVVFLQCSAAWWCALLIQSHNVHCNSSERSLVGLSDVRLMVALPLSRWLGPPALNISPTILLFLLYLFIFLIIWLILWFRIRTVTIIDRLSVTSSRPHDLCLTYSCPRYRWNYAPFLQLTMEGCVTGREVTQQRYWR